MAVEPQKEIRRTAAKTSRVLLFKSVLFIACLIPALSLLTADLGANPIETLTHFTGEWALNFLLISLAITPLVKLSQLHLLNRFRRLLGLYSFAYAMGHLSIYLVLDQGLSLSYILEDVLDRPYITLGFSAFLCLLPLAATSNNWSIKRLGGRRWKKLHKLVFPGTALAIAHFIWLVKSDLREPLAYAGIAVLLITFRLPNPFSPANKVAK